jgi:PEP-CTERM motif
MSLRRIVPLAIILCLSFGINALAHSIIFTHTGEGTIDGTLAGVPFTTHAFTIIAFGDTDDRHQNEGGAAFFINHSFAIVDIEGVGVLTFTTPTRTWTAFQLLGFGHAFAPGSGNNLYDGPFDQSFMGGWDMLSSIGPFEGIGFLGQWELEPVITNHGVLVFHNGSTNATFRASVTTPEPSSLFLITSGLCALGIRLRRSFTRETQDEGE